VFEDVGMSMLGGAAGGALFGGLTSRKPRTVDARAAAAAAGDAGAAAVLAEAENAATLLPVPMPELTPAPEGFLPEGALDEVSTDPADLFLPEDLQELPPPPTEEQLAIYDAANPRRAALANPETAGDPVQVSRDLLRDLAAESQRQIPAVAAEAVADGTFNGDFRGPGSATLDIQDGDVVLRRYATDRQHLTKEGQMSRGAQDLWDTSERNGGGTGVPTIGASRQTAGVSESSYPDYRVEGVFRIPVARFRELMAAGEILLGNVGETEVVISPAVAQQYLAEVSDRGSVQTPAPTVQATPAEKIKLTPAKEEPFTEPDLQIEAPELAQIIETGKIALPPPEYFAARRKRDLRGTNTLSANESAALRQWAAYEAIPAPSEVPRRARKTYQRLFARAGGAAVDTAAAGATYETAAAADPNAAEAPEETLNRIGESLSRIGDETALTEEAYFAPQIEAENQKQREMDAAFVQAVSQGNPVKIADLSRTLKTDDVLVLGDGTEVVVEEVEDDGTLNLWSEAYGMQRIKPAESIGVQRVQQSPLNLYTRSAPEWAASVARQMVPGSEVIMLGDNEFIEIDADPFSLGDKPAGQVPQKQKLRMEGVRGARVRINGKATVVLNRDRVTKDTPVHEVAHGLISALPADVRKRGEALMTQYGRRYLEDIRRRYTRAGVNLSEAGLMEEALVTLLGNEGVAIWDKYVKSGKARRLLMEWIAAVKTWFRDTFGYSPDITLEQWGRMQNERFLASRKKRQGGGTGMSFAGARAETPQFMADSLKTAQAMAAAGKSSEEIRALTGWFPGLYDGKMRWEIPDNKAFAKNVMLAVGQDMSRFDAGMSVQVDLGSLMSHPELFAAYPGLLPLPVVINADSNVAAYTRGSPNGRTLGSIELGLGGSRQMDRRTLSRLLHEVQHAIQEIEGFAQGSNPELSGTDSYTRTAGEIEARDVRARMNFTSEQRAAIAPYSSENIAPEAAVVLGVEQAAPPASAQFSLAPTGMASGPAGTKRLRAVFESEYATENRDDTIAQVREAYDALSRRGASFEEFMSTLRDMNDNAENRWFNGSAPVFFGLMASDADARARNAAGTFGEGKNSPAYRRAEAELRRLEYYQGAIAAAKGQHVKGYHWAWTLTSPERQVAVMARMHLFDGSAAKLKAHDEAVMGISKAAQEHAQAAAADIAPTDVAAQVERLVAADSAAAASDEIIDTATEETRAGITDLLEGALDRVGLEAKAEAEEFFYALLTADVGAELAAAGGTTQLSLADRLATMREEIRARMVKMTPAQRAAEVARAMDTMKRINGKRASVSTRAAQAPDLIAEDPQALAVFKLQKSLELLINSGKRQPKSKTKSDAETVAAAIQAALLGKAGIATKLVPGVDMATTIGLLIANQDSARQVLDQVQSQLNADPKTRGIISSGRLQAFGEAVIGRRFDTDESAPYGPNQIAKAAARRNEGGEDGRAQTDPRRRTDPHEFLCAGRAASRAGARPRITDRSGRHEPAGHCGPRRV
jgi:hypothetical protein